MLRMNNIFSNELVFSRCFSSFI